jgi:integrase
MLELKDLHDYDSVERWLQYVSASGIRSEATEKLYLYFLGRFCQFTKKDPDQLIEDRKQQLKNDDVTIKSEHEHYLAMWQEEIATKGPNRKALARGSIVTGHNIIKSFYLANLVPLVSKSPKSWKTRESSSIVPNQEQLALILKRAKRLRDKTVIICLAQSGISLEDFNELIIYGNIKDELEGGIEPLHIAIERQKIGHYKYDTFLGVNALEYLNQYVKETKPKPKSRVFSLSPRGIEYVVEKASSRAGMDPHITPHRLRAFFSTYMGLSFHTEHAKHLPLIEYWMGHRLPYAGTYMIPPVDGSIVVKDPTTGKPEQIPCQRKLYKDHEYAISVQIQNNAKSGEPQTP